MSRTSIVILLCLTVSAAFAQVEVYETTRIVDITLKLPECNQTPKFFSVIVDGNDLDPIAVQPHKSDVCRWIGEKRTGSPFNAEKRIFSLRFNNGARTICRHGRTVRDKELGLVAQLQYRYKPKTAHAMTITTDPRATYVRYMRDVPAVDTSAGSVACLESGEFHGNDTVQDVSFRLENFLLRIAPARPANFIDFFVDDKLQKELLRPENDGRKLLDPREIVYTLMRQRARIPSKALLNFGSTAIDLDRMRFEQRLPERFELNSVELVLEK